MPVVSTTPPALSVSGLKKSYGDVVAVAGLDLEVRAGECFGLLGPNGAGKTTTIEIFQGIVGPDEGSVRVHGRTWTDEGPALCSLLGIQLQKARLSENVIVDETVLLFRSFYPAVRSVEEVISLLQLDEKRGARVGR